MIEAYEYPPLRAKMVRRGTNSNYAPALPPERCDASIGSRGENLRVFVGAYLGALAFFLVWLS